jgi:nucleoside phosphorylase
VIQAWEKVEGDIRISSRYQGSLQLLGNGMGNVRAAAATQQAIAVWNPAQILLTGIAGGIEKSNNRLLGDLIVAEQVVDYEFGKQTPEGIQRRYQVYRPAKVLLDAARRMPPANWAMSIRAPRPDGTSGRVVPQVHFGVLCSGQKVITDPHLVSELKADWVELVGVEMEAIGLALAAYESEQVLGFPVVKAGTESGLNPGTPIPIFTFFS